MCTERGHILVSLFIAVLLVLVASAQHRDHHSHGHNHRPYHQVTNTSGIVVILDRLVALNRSLTSFSKLLNSAKVLHSLEGLEESAHDIVQHLIVDGGSACFLMLEQM